LWRNASTNCTTDPFFKNVMSEITCLKRSHLRVAQRELKVFSPPADSLGQQSFVFPRFSYTDNVGTTFTFGTFVHNEQVTKTPLFSSKDFSSLLTLRTLGVL
jgi:hypothetical protein